MSVWFQLGLTGAGGGLIAALARLLTLRREAKKLDLDNLREESAIASSLYAEVVALRSDALALHRRADTMEVQGRSCDAETARLSREVAELHQRMALVLAAGTLRDYKRLMPLFNLSRDGWVFSTPEGGGTLVAINTVFCRWLGRSPEDVLQLNWRKLVHPIDLRKTEQAETRASFDPLDGFVNRYQHADGHYVILRWFVVSYAAGIAISLVRCDNEEQAA